MVPSVNVIADPTAAGEAGMVSVFAFTASMFPFTVAKSVARPSTTVSTVASAAAVARLTTKMVPTTPFPAIELTVAETTML